MLLIRGPLILRNRVHPTCWWGQVVFQWLLPTTLQVLCKCTLQTTVSLTTGTLQFLLRTRWYFNQVLLIDRFMNICIHGWHFIISEVHLRG